MMRRGGEVLTEENDGRKGFGGKDRSNGWCSDGDVAF